MTLDRLSPGKTCRILSLSGCAILKVQLLALGITPGTIIKVRKTALSGDPIQITTRGCEVALRLSEAKHILISEVIS